MYDAIHQTHGDPAQPYVAMTEAEALRLAYELSIAITSYPSDHTSETLTRFFEEHCKAFGLGLKVPALVARASEAAKPKPPQYGIVYGANAGELQQEVTRMLATGWRPLGGPYVLGHHIGQALVRRLP